MSQKFNKPWYKLVVLIIGGFTILVLICSGLFIANFSQYNPILIVNSILGSILGLGFVIISAFHVLATYEQIDQSHIKKSDNLDKKIDNINQTQLMNQQKKINRVLKNL